MALSSKGVSSPILNLTITAFYIPDNEVNLDMLENDLVSCLKDCKDLSVIHYHLLESDGKNRDLHSDYYLQVKCSAISKLKTRPDLEGHFAACKNWTSSSDLFAQYDFRESFRPWLSVEDDNAFYQLCRSCHDSVSLRSVSFGTLINPSEVEIHRRIEGTIISNFYHDSRKVDINFSDLKSKLEVQYSSIRRIFMSGRDKALIVYLEVAHPPLSYHTVPPPNWKEKEGNPTSNFRERILTPWSKNVIEAEETIFCKNVMGKSNVVKLEFDVDRIIGYQIVSRLHFKCGKIPVHWVLMNEELNYTNPTKFINDFKVHYKRSWDSISFNCGYLLHAIMERNFVLKLQIGPKEMENFYNDLESMHALNKRCLEAALTKSFYLLNDGTLLNYWVTIRKLFEYYSTDESKIDVLTLNKPRNTETIRRVVITPTQVLFYPPELMFTNRVLRLAQPDHALKISFRDDTFQKLSIPFFCSKEIHEWSIKIPMTGDFRVFNRKYQLLGWSNSQLHDHSVWMYSPDSDKEDVQSLRNMMGDFSKIKTVSKYMARIGQCFTSTEETIIVPNSHKYIHLEDDIYSGNLKSKVQYCFSDGIGRISRAFLNKVCRKMNLETPFPCALQIRYAGYKGMLVLDPKLYEEFIVFRKSMLKFDCPRNENSFLEVVKFSKPTPVYLNRPLIMILDQLGIAFEVFSNLQEEMLKRSTIMLLNEEAAASFLASRCSLPGLEYKLLAKAGAGLTVDPFFKSMLLTCHQNSIAKIRSNCRYEIDMSLGRSMFGVLDEYGVLEYGQVFVQYSTVNPNTKRTSVVCHKGKVLVTKNPCMQAGDVRLLKAVDHPSLHHIVDCIVFPQRGKRPHPNEMAGSDLDGDEYVVIWDRRFFFDKNHLPTDFPVPIEQSMKNITESDIINFLIHYVKNDLVGKIASAHLAKADREENGIFSPVCASLAQKYSLAVDFAKSGQIKAMETLERPKFYPDFMERTGRTYKSQRALGYLYRTCCDFERINADYTLAYRNISIDSEFEYHGWQVYQESAKHSLKRYNARLSSLLSWYGIKDEVEVITGNINKVHNQNQPGNELFVIRQLVLRYIDELWSEFVEEFEFEFLDEMNDSSDSLEASMSKLALQPNNRPLYPQKMLQKASAWYMVTYGNPSSQLLSFPWVVSKYLAAIKKSKRGIKPVTDPLVEKLNADLHQPYVLKQLLQEETRQYIDALRLFRSKLLPTEDIVLAFQALYKWASTQKLFDSGKFFEKRDQLYALFLKFINRNNDNVRNAVSLVIQFFSYCSQLPHECNRDAMKDLYEKQLLNSAVNNFGIRCMQAFHSICVSNNFEELGIVIEGTEAEILLEMEPIKMPIEFIQKGSRTGYIKEKKILQGMSGVRQIQIRDLPHEKIVYISAVGSITNIRFLEEYLKSELDKIEEDD